MNASQLRNIGIIAHIDAGKTTLSERILFYSDTIHRMGEVHEGAATMDFLPEEQERGITIASACITCLWNGKVINLVDTPGHVDFTVEVERCLRVLDGAVGVFCAVAGVEPQSETVWRQADEFGIPRLAVINKMDRPGADFAAALEAMRERLGANPVPVTVPLGQEEEFEAVLDVVRQERVDFDGSAQGKTVSRRPFTDAEAALAAPWRERLMDALTLEDDRLLDIWLSGETPPVDMLDAALRKGTLARRFVPVYAASALRNIGVQPVLDGVCAYLPSPLDSPPAMAHTGTGAKEAARHHQDSESVTLVRPDPADTLCALVFKVVMSGGRKTVFLRLYSGTVREGEALLNASTGKRERVMRLYRLHADRRENLVSAQAGDIVAAQGLKEAQTGDTLLGKEPLMFLEPLRSWRPVISLAFEPRNSEEGERLDQALATFTAEDPTLAVELNEATGQRIVSGMGELHLEVLADRLRREWNISPRLGNPQVVCRETIGGEADATGEFDRELGGQAHYGKVSLHVAPQERNSGIAVSFAPNACAPGEWNAALLAAVEQGVRDACWSGPAGYVMEDLAITVTGLGKKQNLATAPGMHMAAQQAVRQAVAAARPQVREPIMQVDISVPENFLGGVIALLGARGARVENLEDKGGQKHVQALAPMRGLFGFSTALRSASQGRAGLMMQFLRFDTV
jgi:elongation factor G